jgi:hypothetical protein
LPFRLQAPGATFVDSAANTLDRRPKILKAGALLDFRYSTVVASMRTAFEVPDDPRLGRVSSWRTSTS